MELHELQLIETEEGMSFAINSREKLEARGTDEAIDHARERIGSRIDEVVVLVRKRQGLPEIDEAPVVTREISVGVPALAIQRQNYVRWFNSHSTFYHPTGPELDKMFSVLTEGDLVFPDFALSFTVRRPNGLLVQVDRQGRITEPSPYSPALKK
jgi:hypothetical protein